MYDVAARTIDRVGSENGGIRPYLGDGIALWIDLAEVIAASVLRLGFLEQRPGARILRVMRSLRKVHLPNDLARVCVDDVDVIGRVVLPGRHIEHPPVRLTREATAAGAEL